MVETIFMRYGEFDVESLNMLTEKETKLNVGVPKVDTTNRNGKFFYIFLLNH